MASKWDGQPCPLCGAGTLHDGVKTIAQDYKRRVFSSATHGAFCDHCTDGFVEFDTAEEVAWLAFRDQVDAEERAGGNPGGGSASTLWIPACAGMTGRGGFYLVSGVLGLGQGCVTSVRA